jgi:hypothetical protein
MTTRKQRLLAKPRRSPPVWLSHPEEPTSHCSRSSRSSTGWFRTDTFSDMDVADRATIADVDTGYRLLDLYVVTRYILREFNDAP